MNYSDKDIKGEKREDTITAIKGTSHRGPPIDYPYGCCHSVRSDFVYLRQK